MKNLKLIAIATIVALSACNEKKENTETATIGNHSDTTTKKVEVNAFKEYIELKNALVESDASKAKTEAGELQNELAKLPESNADAQTALSHAKHLASTDKLEEQREAFSSITNSFISLAKSGTIGENKYYIQHCPMALKGKGADWISEEEKIKNPYFGDEMLNCGETKVTVK